MSRRTRGVLSSLALLLVAALVSPAQATDTVVYYHTDALRSVAVVTNSSGAVIERTHYAPYGQVLNRPLRDGPGYTGHREDANTGLVYMQQRYYDPESGRFLSADPVQANGAGGNFNRYWYANNNPYRYIDRDGRCTGSHISNSDGTCVSTGTYTTQLETGALSAGRKLVAAAFDGAGSSSLPDNRAFTQLARSIGAKVYDTKAVTGTDENDAVNYVAGAKEASPRSRVVLLGYSAGGDVAIDVASKLADRGVRTDALVTFDPHSAMRLFGYHNYRLSGIGVALNFYQRNSITRGWFGIPYGSNPFVGGRISCSTCYNVDLTGLPVDHTSIVQYALQNYGSQIETVINP
jgi:RHS repeat-associated protein